MHELEYDSSHVLLRSAVSKAKGRRQMVFPCSSNKRIPRIVVVGAAKQLKVQALPEMWSEHYGRRQIKGKKALPSHGQRFF